MAVKLFIRATKVAAPLIACAMGLAMVLTGPVQAEQLASLPSLQMGGVDLPRVLTSDDVQRYGKIFALQDKGEWRKADREIKRLSNRILMGHVQAQRYLHPTKYRSRYKELKAWMAQYNDHHYAKQIYKLALRRRPANFKYPAKPKAGRALYEAPRKAVVVDKPKRKRLSRAQRRRVATLKVMLKSYLRKGHTLSAKQLIQSAEVKKLFDDYNMDWARGRLAKGYFMDGRDDWAVEWAEKASKRSGKYLPSAHWIAGLAYWRLGQMEKSAEQFERSAKYDNSPWTQASSAFWAARANLIARHPQKVTALLEQAADHPRTFYGMLANRLLGRTPQFDWALPPMDGTEVQGLMQSDGGRRAVALLQIGKNSLAEKEMRQTARLAPREQAHGMLAIAAHTGMAELTMRLDAMLFPNGGGFDGAAYPLPSWEPTGGFKVDRALIYALVRQESRFNPKAKSGVGARGLMQLMPRTASFVARDRTLRWNKRSQLFDPAFNLKLGQKYVSMLLTDRKIKGDMFLMAAAWNGGPGNLNKWRRRVDDLDDSLFFIESLPSRETRIFIERVLTNLWIYSNQLGQSTPSLDAVASGAWPMYNALGQEPQQVAQNVKN
ncbi:MAG: lytic transglycosylase domain-containing protein [Magnetovibrio sp.]|nr:lytic transglycosylase domain-containing protein [Magnetovibrio sp.]